MVAICFSVPHSPEKVKGSLQFLPLRSYIGGVIRFHCFYMSGAIRFHCFYMSGAISFNSFPATRTESFSCRTSMGVTRRHCLSVV